jgi:hypothetical protein
MQETKPDPRWSFIERIHFPWLQQLYRRLPKNKVPLLSGEVLLIGTDSSGMQRGSRYVVVGAIVMDMTHSPTWHRDRLRIRRDILRDGRRMSYKNLNDAQRRKALVPFLEAADQINGICLLMAFDKRLGRLCTWEGLYEKAKLEGIIKGKWNQSNLEQMMRTVQLVSTLLAAVAVRGQNIYWISDLDECFATEERKMDTARMMSSFTSEYIKHDLGELGIGTTEIDEGDRLEEDLTAIPDLAAGAVSDLLNQMHHHLGTIPLVPTFVPTLSGKTDLIASWFFSGKGQLVKLASVVRFVAHKHMQVGFFSTEPEGGIVML